jgi:hypothetical protein
VSYELIEASVYDGDIVELYEFTLGTTVWRFTSASTDYTYAGNEYISYTIDRTKNERTGEMNRVKTQIYMDGNNPIVLLFVQSQPRNQIGVRVFAGHRGDDDFRLQFSGRVLNCKWSGNRSAELTCEPEMTSWRRPSLKVSFSKNCPYVVYSSKCRAPRNSVGGTIKYISGLNIYVEPNIAITAGRLIGGIISEGINSRTITSHTNGTYLGDSVVMLTITAQISGAIVGYPVALLIGCNHSTTACKDWHDNIDNFGGEPYTPEKNPFVGKFA